jgi:hypothetical protein
LLWDVTIIRTMSSVKFSGNCCYIQDIQDGLDVVYTYSARFGFTATKTLPNGMQYDVHIPAEIRALLLDAYKNR